VAAADRPVPAWTVSAFDLTGSQEHEQYVHSIGICIFCV
jgi:hypothetical protein